MSEIGFLNIKKWGFFNDWNQLSEISETSILKRLKSVFSNVWKYVLSTKWDMFSQPSEIIFLKWVTSLSSDEWKQLYLK